MLKNILTLVALAAGHLSFGQGAGETVAVAAALV